MADLTIGWRIITEIALRFGQGLLLLLTTPLVVGFLRFLKAAFTARQRPWGVILQPYWDLSETIRRPAVRAKSISQIFKVTPAMLLGIYGSLVFTVPVISRLTLVPVDLILVMYCMGLARFMISLAGIDATSPFAWLGSSREMYYQLMTEINLAFFMLGLAISWSDLTISGLVKRHAGLIPELFFAPALDLLALSLGVIIIFEAGRLPVENPTTHLELTMGAKGIFGEFGGRDLAILEYAEMLKLNFLITLFVALFLPLGIDAKADISWLTLLALGLYPLKTGIILFILSFWEVTRPKRRLKAVTEFGMRGVLLSLFAIILVIFGVGPILMR